MPEFSQGHHFHDRGDGVGLPATDDLARHDRADRFIQYSRTALAEHPHDIALRQDAFDAAVAHHHYGADLPFRQNLDRGRELCVRLDALDLMAFGIENCTYRHCRLPEADRPLARPRPLLPLSLQSTVQRRVLAGALGECGHLCTLTGSCPLPRYAKMMDEIVFCRKRRSAAVRRV